MDPDPDDRAAELELAEVRMREQIAARRRRRSAWDAASWSQTWQGTLAHLARSGAPIRCLTTSGERFEATLTAVGADVVVATSARARVVLRPEAIAAIEPLGDPGPPADGPVADVRFVEVVADLVGTGEQVRVVLGQGTAVTAAVASCGLDVVTLETSDRSGGPGRGMYYVALDSLSEIWSSSPS